MQSDLSCNTVKDLLPIYLDGIASEETNNYLKKHLSECKLCQGEYKRVCESAKKDEEIVKTEVDSIKSMRKRLIMWFIAVIIIGMLLVALAMFSEPAELARKHSMVEIIATIQLYAAVYFFPLVGLFVAIIWRKTISNKEKDFWPNVIIWFLGIGILTEVVFLVWKFLCLRGYC